MAERILEHRSGRNPTLAIRRGQWSKPHVSLAELVGLLEKPVERSMTAQSVGWLLLRMIQAS
jgi:hypothetical protein